MCASPATDRHVHSGSVERLAAAIAARTRRIIVAEPVGAANSARRAAVLVPIVGSGDQLRLVLFERNLEVAEHKGEICFPGGSIETGDADAISAALREAWEELGIPPADVKVLGCLDDVHTVKSNYVITPVVGYLETMPVLIPDPAEVARSLVLTLNSLSAPDAWQTERIDVGGAVRDFEAHRVGDARIWGATARILRLFLELCRDASFPTPAQGLAKHGEKSG
jgi:8-oxo-dGTP pyrophosphatase MutT (NUDIX family)